MCMYGQLKIACWQYLTCTIWALVSFAVKLEMFSHQSQVIILVECFVTLGSSTKVALTIMWSDGTTNLQCTRDSR